MKSHRIVLSLSLTAMLCVSCGDDDSSGETAGSGGSAAGSGGSGGSGGSAGEGGSEEIPVATAKEKEDSCDCYAALKFLPDDTYVEECVGNITDACVACIKQVAGSDECATVEKSEFYDCGGDCKALFTPPEDAQQCKEMIAGRSTLPTESTDCICDECLESFAPCVVSPLCQEIVLCGAENGCSGTECYIDETTSEPGPCFEVIGQALNTDAEAVTAAQDVGTCNLDNGCTTGAAADGGVDAGADGG